MTLFFTVTTLQQLPQALALGESLRQHQPADRFVIGLADDSGQIPATFQCPYELIPVTALPVDLPLLSEKYNPAEFAAAVKPLFLRHLWQTRPEAEQVVYLAPSIYLYRPLTELTALFADSPLLLTPHLLRPPADEQWPDEKYFQNVGLFHAGFLGLRRSENADHFVEWWSQRAPERAFVDFCEGMCLDQVWLMMTVVFYPATRIVKNPGWHVGLWNLHERNLRSAGTQQTADGQPLAFFNFDGFVNRSLLFDGQNRVRLSAFPAAQALVRAYRQVVQRLDADLSRIAPAYGRQVIKYPLPAWRKSLLQSLRQTVQFIDTVDVPRKM